MSKQDKSWLLDLWKAFCKSRIALAIEYDATDAVINKWNNRMEKMDNNQIIKYVQESITCEGHVLDDPF